MSATGPTHFRIASDSSVEPCVVKCKSLMNTTPQPPTAADLAAAPALRSRCPVACSLDVLGDRWTLLVIRDLFAGKSRFGEFVASPEHIPTNILSERLKRLERAGLISSTAYSQHPLRFDYHL